MLTETSKGGQILEARLTPGASEGGAAGGHPVTMRRGTAPTRSQHCRGGPEKYPEGTLAFVI